MSALAISPQPETHTREEHTVVLPEYHRQLFAAKARKARMKAKGEEQKRRRRRQEILARMRANPSKPIIKGFLYDHHVNAMHEYNLFLLKGADVQELSISLFGESYNPEVDYKPRIKMSDVAQILAQKHNGISLQILRGPTRHNSHVVVRHEFCYLAMQSGLWSLSQVGRFINRDHTTVIHAVNAHCYKNNLKHPITGEKVTAKMAGVRIKKTVKRAALDEEN